jgi:hypothetical protein
MIFFITKFEYINYLFIYLFFLNFLVKNTNLKHVLINLI